MPHYGRTCEHADAEAAKNHEENCRLRRRINEINEALNLPPGAWDDEHLREVVGRIQALSPVVDDAVRIHEGTIRLLASALKYWSGRSGPGDDERLLNEAAFLLNQLLNEPEPEPPAVVMRLDGERFDLTIGQRNAIKRLLDGWEEHKAVPDTYHPCPL